MAGYGHLRDADLDEDVQGTSIIDPLDILSLGPGMASPQRSITTDSYSLVSAQADFKDSPLTDAAPEALRSRSDSHDLDLLGGSGLATAPSESRFGPVATDPLTSAGSLFEEESLAESPPKRSPLQHAYPGMKLGT